MTHFYIFLAGGVIFGLCSSRKKKHWMNSDFFKSSTILLDSIDLSHQYVQFWYMNRELDFRFSTHLKRERTIPTIDGSCWDHFWVIAESPADAIKEEQSCPIFDTFFCLTPYIQWIKWWNLTGLAEEVINCFTVRILWSPDKILSLGI